MACVAVVSLLTFCFYALAVAAAAGKTLVLGHHHPRCLGRTLRSQSTLVRSIATFGNLLIPASPNRITATAVKRKKNC